MALNTIVAESLDYWPPSLEKATAAIRRKLNAAVQKLLTEIITEHGAIIFNGDDYSEAWHEEAAKRGLPNLQDHGRRPARADQARVDRAVRRSTACSQRARAAQPLRDLPGAVRKTVGVEAKLTLEMAKTMIFPAAIRYQNELAANVWRLKLVGLRRRTRHAGRQSALPISELTACAGRLKARLAEHGGESAADEAAHAQSLLPAMAAVRKVADELEGVVADDLWPLPTYQEMLFIL